MRGLLLDSDRISNFDGTAVQDFGQHAAASVDLAHEARLKAVHASSRLTGYRWGLDRKKKLLAREQTGRPKHGP